MSKRNPYLYGPATPKARREYNDAAQRFYGSHNGERESARRHAIRTHSGEGAIDMVKGSDGVWRCPA